MDCSRGGRTILIGYCTGHTHYRTLIARYRTIETPRTVPGMLLQTLPCNYSRQRTDVDNPLEQRMHP